MNTVAPHLTATASLLICLVGSPVTVVFYVRWDASKEYERNSFIADCIVLRSESAEKCRGKSGNHVGNRWGYNVVIPLCGNDTILYKSDDTCNRNPIPINTTKQCWVENDCSQFKWSHSTTYNVRGFIAGLVVLFVSFVMFLIGGCLFVKSLKEERSQLARPVTFEMGMV